MTTTIATMGGPFGLRFALRGRRLALLAVVPLLWALGAPPSWTSLAGVALVLATLAVDQKLHRSPKGWGSMLDALPPLGILAGVAPLAVTSPTNQFWLSLGGYLLAAVWLNMSIVVPRVTRDQLVAEAERYAAAQAEAGKPFHRITLAFVRPLNGLERGISFWRIPSADSHGAHDIKMVFPVRVDRGFEETEMAQQHHTVLWQGPVTAHERMAWAARTAALTV